MGGGGVGDGFLDESGTIWTENEFRAGLSKRGTKFGVETGVVDFLEEVGVSDEASEVLGLASGSVGMEDEIAANVVFFHAIKKGGDAAFGVGAIQQKIGEIVGAFDVFVMTGQLYF